MTTDTTARELLAIAARRIREMVAIRRQSLDPGAIAGGNQFLAGMWAAYEVVEADLTALEKGSAITP